MSKLGRLANFGPFLPIFYVFNCFFSVFAQYLIRFWEDFWAQYVKWKPWSIPLNWYQVPEYLATGWPDIQGQSWAILTFLAKFTIFMFLFHSFNFLAQPPTKCYQPRHQKKEKFSIFAPTSLREAKIENFSFFWCLAPVAERTRGILFLFRHNLYGFFIINPLF